MKLSDQLRREWALIDQPSKWTKGELSRDKTGRAVTLASKSACKFCQEGARRKVSRSDDESIDYGYYIFSNADNFARSVAKLFGFFDAVHLNDHSNTTHDGMRIFYETMIYIAEQCE